MLGAAELGEETVRAYHGTTAVAAAAIAHEGSRSPDVDALVAEAVQRFGVPEAELRHELRAAYVNVGVHRDAFAVALHRDLAAKYAGIHGGEANFEVVAAAVRVSEGCSPPQAEGHARRLLAARGAVLVLDIPFERFLDLPMPGRRKEWTYAEWQDFAASVGSRPLGRNIRVRPPAEPHWVVDVELLEFEPGPVGGAEPGGEVSPRPG